MSALPPARAGEGPALTGDPKAVVMEARDVSRAVSRIAHEILERNKGAADVVLVGMVRRGAQIAARLAERIKEIEGAEVASGSIDIGLYRDDIGLREPSPLAPSKIPPIDGKVVVLVDDVLFTGRSARAALEALMAAGRPRAVQLAVLIDRGHRELPIRADYVGKNIPTSRREDVAVLIRELDGEDLVALHEGPAGTERETG